jgi:hypothetical protein
MREADANLVAELQRGLENKEGLVCRLSHLNNEAQAGMHRDAQVRGAPAPGARRVPHTPVGTLWHSTWELQCGSCRVSS